MSGPNTTELCTKLADILRRNIGLPPFPFFVPFVTSLSQSLRIFFNNYNGY